MYFENFVIPCISVILSSVVSFLLATSRSKQVCDKALEEYKGAISAKVYIDSKRFDLELQMYKELNSICADIYAGMHGVFRVRMREYIIHEKPVELIVISEKVQQFETEINRNAPFIEKNIYNDFMRLCEIADKFVSFTNNYKGTDPEQMGSETTNFRRDEAYSMMERYKDIWDGIMLEIRDYLTRMDGLRKL